MCFVTVYVFFIFLYLIFLLFYLSFLLSFVFFFCLHFYFSFYVFVLYSVYDLFIINKPINDTVLTLNSFSSLIYYAALLPRRGPHIASHSVCLSVRLFRYLSLPSVTWRHLANYNVLFGWRRGPHIVRPSRPHKLVSHCFLTFC